MISKITKIKLARLLQCVSEAVLKDGRVLYSDGELAIGEEVFVYNEENELIPAVDGEYESDKYIYVVADGKITEIREYQNAEDTETKEVEVANEMANEEGEEETEQAEETETIEDLKVKLADKEAEVEELNKQIEEIKSANQEVIDRKDKEISDLQATIAEYKEKEGKSVEESVEEQEEKFSKQTEKQNNVLNLLKSRKK